MADFSFVNHKQRTTLILAMVLLDGLTWLGCGGGIGPAPSPVVAVSISPARDSLLTGETAQFEGVVTGTANVGVTWSVDGVAGGNAMLGTISSTGLYTAPGAPPSPNTVTVRATSAVDSTKSASASVTIANPAPTLSALSLSTIDAGSPDATLGLTGTGFAQQSVVEANGTALATTFGSDTSLSAIIPASMLESAGTLSITVATPEPGGGTSAALSVEVQIGVSVSPGAETLDVSATEQFMAMVKGSTDTIVNWFVNGVEGGDAAEGTISAAGLYTAPAVPPTPNVVTVEAVSAADSSRSAQSTVTVVYPAPVLYSASPDALTTGSGDTTLTLGGSGFVAQSTVDANATPLAVTLVSPTELTAIVPATLMSSTGTLTITVVTPVPGGGTSTSIALKIWPGYPRDNAGSILSTPPPLPQIPIQGTTVSVLDWTAKDNEGTTEDVLAADHMLSEMGIPNIDTTDLNTAAANPFLVVAGVLNTDSALSSGEIAALTTYVQSGGTLYLWEPSVPALLTALGIAGQTPHTGTAVRPLSFDFSSPQPDPLLRYIDNPAETNWQPSFPSADLSVGYAPGTCVPLAWWDTSDAALVRCNLGAGRAYVFGWRLRPLLTLPEREIVPGTEPPNTNAFVPDADIARLLMRGSYEGYAPNLEERQFAPGGHHAALIITHDVDAIVSYENVPKYVDLEKSLGIKSTFLFTTNPYDTGWIAPMYDGTGMESIQYALDAGFDIESHSFGHFPDFATAPFGTGSETAANYMPMFSWTTMLTSGMSVLGEMGVSRWLLQNDFGVSVEGFRSGYLDIPGDFLKGLSETGYERDTSYSAGLTRGSFPFVTFDVDTSTGTVTTYPVMEYPVTISDETIDSSTYDQYLSEWESVIRANYANNAPTILLLHPVDATIRLQALQDLLQRVADLDLWIGDWKTFAKFWEAQGVTDARWP